MNKKAGALALIASLLTAPIYALEQDEIFNFPIASKEQSQAVDEAVRISDQFNEKVIDFIIKRGIAKSVNVESKITRAEAAQILYNFANNFHKQNLSKNSFKDVPRNSWYAKAVDFAVSKGIVSDSNLSNFYPKRNISAGELAVMLIKFYKISGVTESTLPNSASWNKTALGTLEEKGILEKASITDAKQEITRWQLYTMLYELSGV